jgi:predicted amidophosphoribosyltransferase
MNARTAYRLSGAEERELIAGARILLIDDIATSMSTINSCAAALKSGGAAEVVGAVLASPP